MTDIVVNVSSSTDIALTIAESPSINVALVDESPISVATVGVQGLEGGKGADGKSAYQAWLDNGNTGTEEEFLDSLVSTVPGPAGEPGTTDYNNLDNKPFIPTSLVELSDDATHRTVTDVQIITWDEAAATAAVTNLGTTVTTSSVTVTSDTGTDATISAATASAAGVATATQITKLDGIATGATANATDAQLRDRATHTGTQAQSTIDGLATDLSNKQPLATVLTNTTASFTTAQETKLSGIASGAEVNVNADWNAASGDAQILNKPSTFAPATHGNEAHSTAYASEATAAANTKALNEIASTGLVSGCEMTINLADPSTYDMAEGTGVIFDNYTDPANPTRIVVAIPARTGISPEYLLTDATTYVFADATGALVCNNYGSTAADRRELISIGWVDHPDHMEVSEAKVHPFAPTAVASQLNDFFLSFGPFNVNGNKYAPAGLLTIARSAGETFDSNANYEVDRQSPHIIKTVLESPCDIYYYYRNGSGGWVNDNAAVTNLDPNYYDDGSGTLAAVGAGKWTIQVVSFYAQTLTTDVQYGQVVYDTYAAAKTALQDAVDINPYNSYDTFRGWILVKQGATDLTNTSQADFVAAGKFGLVDVASGGGTGGEVNTASNIGLSGVGLYHQKIGVDLQFKNVSASGVLSLDDNATTHVVTVQHTDDTNTRHVTDIEKSTWNGKQNALGYTAVPDSRTVNGHALTGDVSVTKGDVGLGSAENTSDADKPISTATQTALNGKEPTFSKNTAFNKDFGTTAGTVTQGNDSRLSDARTPTTHSHAISDVTNLQTTLDGLVEEALIDGKQYARKDGAWTEVVSGGGAGTQEVFVQATAPSVTAGTQYIWFQTGLGTGNDMTLWVEDGL